MNERISELCHQAYEFANSNCCDEFGSVDEYKRRSKFEEKFAELIVRECSMFVVTELEGQVGSKIADTTANKLEEHFGVE